MRTKGIVLLCSLALLLGACQAGNNKTTTESSSAKTETTDKDKAKTLDKGVWEDKLYARLTKLIKENGNTSSSYDKNKKFHWVARFSYPFKVGNQIIEPGIQAYTGKFVLPKTTVGTITHTNKEYLDQRIAASFVLYPQPFGIQAEYNIGKGPEYDVATNKLGMIYAKKNQVITYEKTESEYVRQFEDIPR